MQTLGRAIRQWIRSYGQQGTIERVKEGIKDNIIKAADIRLGGLANGLIGEGWQSKLTKPSRALEAVDAVDVSAFQDITGQLLITETQKAYDNPEFVGDKLMRVIDEGAPYNLNAMIVPKVSNVLSGPSQVSAGAMYPSTTMVEDWVSYPAIGKYGEVLNIFLETVLADRTGQIQESAAKLGRRARLNREERQLQVVLGLNNNFSWKGTTYNTYLNSGTNWINQQTAIPAYGVADYTIVNKAEQLFAQMLDPYSLKPIDIQPSGILCMPETYYDFKKVIHATQIWQGNTAVTGGVQTHAEQLLETDYPLYKSKIARQLLINSGLTATQVRDYWYMADFQRAFIYRQVLPWEILEAPPNNEQDFNQDVVMRIKVREMGAAGVHDPRYTMQSTNT